MPTPQAKVFGIRAKWWLDGAARERMGIGNVRPIISGWSLSWPNCTSHKTATEWVVRKQCPCVVFWFESFYTSWCSFLASSRLFPLGGGGALVQAHIIAQCISTLTSSTKIKLADANIDAHTYDDMEGFTHDDIDVYNSCSPAPLPVIYLQSPLVASL